MCRENDEEVILALKSGERLDVFIANNAEGITRSFAQNLIKKGEVTVDGAVQKANYRLKEGQTVRFALPEPELAEALPEDIPLDVVYEDGDIIVVNKPAGMVVHPAVGNPSGTLVNALLFSVKDLAGIGGALRPGIVHRIDKDTSGLLVVAKNDAAMRSLSAQIQQRTAGREYIALVDGVIGPDEGTIRAPIARHPKDRKKMAVVQGGREATTHFRVLERFPADQNGASGSGNTLVLCALETAHPPDPGAHGAHRPPGDRGFHLWRGEEQAGLFRPGAARRPPPSRPPGNGGADALLRAAARWFCRGADEIKRRPAAANRTILRKR